MSADPNGPHSPTHSRKDSGTATLRSSCDTCAASKIRCTKEKPECSKCTKRGLSCSYSIPRRPGRPQQNRSTHAKSAPTRPQASGSGSNSPGSNTFPGRRSYDSSSFNLMELPTSPSTGVPPMDTIIPPADFSNDQISPELCSQLIDSLLAENQSWNITPAPSSTDLDQLFDLNRYDSGYSSMDMGGDLFNVPVMDQGLPDAPAPDMPSLEQLGVSLSPLTFNTPDQGLPSLPTPAESSPNMTRNSSMSFMNMPGNNEQPPQPMNMPQPPNPITNPDSCWCQGRAMSLMVQPTPAQTKKDKPHNDPPSFESVLDQNNTATDAMARILQCPCGKDAYLLVVLVLATYKTLEWFDAAASVGSTAFVSLPSAGIDGHNSNSGEDPSRTAALIVLSRLPSVQRVVDTLSDQLRSLRVNDGASQSGSSGSSRTASHPVLSSSLADNLERNLKTKTQELAQRVIVKLR